MKICDRAIAYAPDGGRVFIVGQDNTLKSWNVEASENSSRGQGLSLAGLHTGAHVSFNFDGTLLAACGWEPGHIGVWNTRTFDLEQDLFLEGALHPPKPFHVISQANQFPFAAHVFMAPQRRLGAMSFLMSPA